MKGTVKDVSRLLLLTKSRIYALVKLGILPKATAGGGFDIDSCVQSYVRYLKRPTGAVDQEIRLKKLKADLLEMKCRQRAGELVEWATITPLAFQRDREIRDTVLNVPDRISGLLHAAQSMEEVHRLLTKELTQCLEGLSDEKKPD
jgi:hypothetical protein